MVPTSVTAAPGVIGVDVTAGTNSHVINTVAITTDGGHGINVQDYGTALVENSAGLIRRARENAAHNQLANVEFHVADLAQDLSGHAWMRAGFDRLLLDPPRSGADVVLKQLPLKGLKRIVYVSCHPASLARDAGYLVNERGWKLRAAGVMDMFPHTAHVESIAVFEARRG